MGSAGVRRRGEKHSRSDRADADAFEKARREQGYVVEKAALVCLLLDRHREDATCEARSFIPRGDRLIVVVRPMASGRNRPDPRLRGGAVGINAEIEAALRSG